MSIQAILLAAGVGRRLASLEQRSPKCLLRFDGESLLRRHMRTLEHCGVRKLLVVVGHMANMIEDEIRGHEGELEIDLVLNERYREGSIISLKTGLHAADPQRDAIVMDADVLYHPLVLQRLVDAPFETGFLLDPRASSDGEEMMLGVRKERVCRIARQMGEGWDLLGEGVGFFRISRPDIPILKREIEHLLGQEAFGADYEQAIDAFLAHRPAGFISVADLPWTEIDFDEDVEHARRAILPAIDASSDGNLA